MPRSELNRPTERIRRVLDDFDGLEAYVEAIEACLTPEQIEHGKLPPRPSKTSVVEEKARQQFTGKKVDYQRLHKRRKSEIGAVAKHSLTEQDLKDIQGMLDQPDSLQPEDLDKGLKLGD